MAVTLRELISREFGVKTTYRKNPLVSQCAVARTKLLSNNPNRVAFVMVNLGANDVYIGFDVETSNTSGILLASAGGGISLNYRYEFDLVASEVHGVATAGASNMYILEIVTMPFEHEPFKI